MPATAGDYTYTLTCNNAQGSAAASAKPTVMPAPPSSGGGGGGLDVAALLWWTPCVMPSLSRAGAG
jgi:hypothetical protein